MTYSREDLLNEFYNTIKDKYPTLTEKQIKKVVNGFLAWVKDTIQQDDFQTINIKYFGKFAPLKGKIVGLLNYNNKRFEEHKINKEEFEKKTKKLVNFINNNKDEFKKFNYKILQ